MRALAAGATPLLEILGPRPKARAVKVVLGLAASALDQVVVRLGVAAAHGTPVVNSRRHYDGQ